MTPPTCNIIKGCQNISIWQQQRVKLLLCAHCCFSLLSAYPILPCFLSLFYKCMALTNYITLCFFLSFSLVFSFSFCHFLSLFSHCHFFSFLLIDVFILSLSLPLLFSFSLSPFFVFVRLRYKYGIREIEG